MAKHILSVFDHFVGLLLKGLASISDLEAKLNKDKETLLNLIASWKWGFLRLGYLLLLKVFVKWYYELDVALTLLVYSTLAVRLIHTKLGN